jgi:hypothetical protein
MEGDLGGFGAYAGYGVGALGVVLAIAQMAWARFFSREGEANSALIQQLTERLTALDNRQTKLEADLDEERRLRRQAEDKVHQLQIDNVVLRAELRRHGIDVPAPLVPVDQVAGQ